MEKIKQMAEFLQDKDEIYLGIDEHSLKHQELHTVTEVNRRMVGVLKDDHIATFNC